MAGMMALTSNTFKLIGIYDVLPNLFRDNMCRQTNSKWLSVRQWIHERTCDDVRLESWTNLNCPFVGGGAHSYAQPVDVVWR